jgi:hypothetical protein
MAKRLGLRGRFLETIEIEGALPRRKQPISLASHRERIFCSDCNEHFKHLEDRAIPIVEPMAKGQKMTLDREAQRTLAAWGAKTGFALIAAEKGLEDLVPEGECRHLRKTGLPSENVWVGYAAWDGKAHKFVGAAELEDRSHAVDPPPARRDNYQAVMTVGQLVLKVFGMAEPRLTDRFRQIEIFHQVWPQHAEDFAWPPPAPIWEGFLRMVIEFVPLEPEQPEK